MTRRGAILFLWLWLAVVAVPWLALGTYPIVRDCGRLPVGQGEVWNRILGLWEGC